MKQMELYIHIPFCVRKCNYCDFLSKASDEETRRLYIDALCMEIANSRQKLSGYEISSIFIGGGTPSILSIDEITKVMLRVRECTSILPDCEITIECNPGTLDEEKLRNYRNLSVNRLSFGLQSTNAEELKLLGRIHTYEQFCDNYYMARELGFRNINIDLMSALPKQSLEQYEETLYKVINLNPEHISAYSLIVEENTAFDALYGEHGDRKEELPSVELDRRMYERTKEILGQSGYERYEISNYAKPGYECRHNIGYWKRTEYLGLGLGASSLYQNQRFHNIEDMDQYVIACNQNKSTWSEVETLSRKDAMEEFMFLGLRMCCGVQISEFEQQFHVPFSKIYGEITKKLLEEKVICLDKDHLRLTEYGLDVSNAVFAEFIL